MGVLPNFIKSFFNLTSEDEKVPTDYALDQKIELLSYHLHAIWPSLVFIIKTKIFIFFRYKWKILIRKIFVLSLFFFLGYYAFIKVAKPILIIREKAEFTSRIQNDLIKSPIPKENLLFMTAIMQLESSSRYNVVKGQYWGAFQMGELARQEIGLSSMPLDMFIKDNDIQNWAMNKLMHKNYDYLYDVIKEYHIPMRGGKLIGNNLVTVSGVLAMAHLVGFSATINFIKSNGVIIPEDGNHIPLTKYLQLNGYELILD